MQVFRFTPRSVLPRFTLQSEDDDVCSACKNLHVDKNWVARDGCDACSTLDVPAWKPCKEARISGYVKTVSTVKTLKLC